MKELEQLISNYNILKEKGVNAVLATLVLVEGSSYRQAGARMLVDETGQIYGAISGGCLDGDAQRKALLALHQNQNKLVVYDTSDENDAVVGAQMGCNGIIRVLFEPLKMDNPNNVMEMISKAFSFERSLWIYVLFEDDPTRIPLGTIGLKSGQEYIELIKNSLDPSIFKESIFESNNDGSIMSEVENEGRMMRLFINFIPKPIKLVIVGAGNDAQCLAKLADLIGWQVVIVDGRSTHANENRFESACQIVVDEPDKAIQEVGLDSRSALVLLSHNYQYDFDVLKYVVQISEVPFIGILGPKKKFDRMLDDANQANLKWEPEDLKRIYAPVGLNIGAETPQEIAISIVSEIQAVFTQTDGGHLRDLTRPIHLRTQIEQIESDK